MPAYKDTKKNNWFVSYYYISARKEHKKTTKRNFPTKKAALEWERNYLLKQKADLNMSFESFILLYYEDMECKLRENTWRIKTNIINTKILDFFKNYRLNEIEPKHIIKWQNEMIKYRNKKGKGYSDTYLRKLNSQLSCIFNYAVKVYDLPSNPVHKVGTIGKANAKEMSFWTIEEYQDFTLAIMDKPESFIAFEMLFYLGVRIGELLAITPEDIDFDNNTIRINKSYQRIEGRDVITEPKTPKGNRIINAPDFLMEEIKEYLALFYSIRPNDRIMTFTKSFLHKEMDRGTKISGVKRIRVHDIRHSNITMLSSLGFTAKAIADRVGHEDVQTTFKYTHAMPNSQKEMAFKLNLERRKMDNEDEA